MSDAPWEQSTRPRHSRWLLPVALAVAVVAAGLLARPDAGGTPDGTLSVEPGETVEPGEDGRRPGEATAPPAARAADQANGDDGEPAIPEAPGEWVELGDAPIGAPSTHLGVWTGAELIVGFEQEVAAYDPAAGTWRTLPDVPDHEFLAPRAVWTGQEVVLLGGSAWDGARSARPDGWRLDPHAGGWEPIPPAPSAPLFEPVASWTGAEVILWGGARPGDASELGEWPVRGSAYNPATDRWRVLSEAPVGHVYFSAGVWTGREVVVWGSRHPPGEELRTEAGVAFAAAYDPAADTWRRLPAPPLEHPADAAAVWTGKEVLLWGGPPAMVGAALDPHAAAAVWRVLPEFEADEPGPSTSRLAAAWTGQQAILYGGYPRSVGLVSTTRGDSWQRLPAHRARVHAVAAWTGSEFLVWGGYTPTGPDVDLWAFRPPGSTPAGCRSGDAEPPGEFLPAGWSWSPPPLPGSQPAVTAWTGTHLVAWGGSPLGRRAYLGGSAIDPTTLQRRCLPAPPLAQRVAAGSTWTPAGLFVWGGVPPSRDGALYDPASMTWRLLPDAPLAPGLPDAVVWTGEEVLVWGGSGRGRGALDAGAAYDPATDTWRQLPDAPVALNHVDAAWTGRELIVYGALLGPGNLATTRHAAGIAYAPATDRWRRLPGHPLSPQASAVAWTGEVLVAWDYLLDAAAYDPDTDAWTALDRLPLQQQECEPSSAVAGGKVFASYCGQAALLDPGTGTWQVIETPVEAPGVAPVSAGDAVLFADARGLWSYAPAPTR